MKVSDKEKPKKTTSTKAKPKSTVAKKVNELDLIVLKMQDMKAHDIISMDLTKVSGASFAFFVIAHAPSSTQVAAIAEGVEEVLKQEYKQLPWHREGYQNAEWVLLDYGSIVVHIFKEEIRHHYRLEDLWGDAKITYYESEK